MNASELKAKIEQTGEQPYFFTRETMRFFGDTMKNFGVRQSTRGGVPVWELYRKRPVKHGLQGSFYFDQQTFRRVY